MKLWKAHKKKLQIHQNNLMFCVIFADVFVAQHDFKATNGSDLSFKKGDKLKILHE